MNLTQLHRKFGTQDKCINYLEKTRWNKKPTCLHCGSDNAVEHITIKHSEGHGKGIRTVNTIEGFWSIIKNGIKGSYRSISKKYLPFYLAEFSYKYNNRHLQNNSFEELIENSVKDEKCMLNYKPVRDTKEIAYGKRTPKKCLS